MAMTRRTAKRLAWSGVAWFALMGAIGVTLNVLGGSLEIPSAPGEGTTVVGRVPVSA
jgi:hypothetical protein